MADQSDRGNLPISSENRVLEDPTTRKKGKEDDEVELCKKLREIGELEGWERRNDY